MDRQLKILISLGVVFVLLLGGAAALLLAPSPESSGETPSEPESTAVTLVQKDPSEVVKIESSTGFYAEYDPENEKLTIPALEGLPLDESVLDYILRFAATVTGQREIESGELSDFGITEESPVVTITYSDGSAAVLKIGSEVPGVSTASKYVLMDGKIYIMYDMHLRYFTAEPSEYISTQITPDNYDSSSGACLYKTKNLAFALLDKAFGINRNTDATSAAQFHTGYYCLVPDGQNFAPDDTVISNVSDSLFGMTGEVAAFASSENELDLEAFGLGENYLTAAVTAVGITDDSKVLTFCVDASQPAEGKIYLHVRGSNVVYSIDEENAPLWYKSELSDFYAEKIFVPALENVGKLTLETPEYTLLFSINRDGEGKIKDVDALKTEGGKNISAVLSDSDFSNLFSALCETKQCGSAEEAKDEISSPVLKITVEYTDGKSETLSLSEAPSENVFAAVNGSSFWLLPGGYAEKLLETALGFFG